MTYLRLLQENDQTHMQRNNEEGFKSGRDFLEFVGFLAWYLMLVTCCIIPPCLAYRRRRNWERRNARQIYLQRMAASGLIFLGETERYNTEELDEEGTLERSRQVLKALKTTTLTIRETDLVKKPSRLKNEDRNGSDATFDEESNEIVFDETNSVDNEHMMLKLENVPNGKREVPATCTICLSSYEVGDSVCHSPNEHCIHVFHKDCVLAWLSKKDQTLCPCCRQEFCNIKNSHSGDGTIEETQAPNTIIANISAE